MTRLFENKIALELELDTRISWFIVLTCANIGVIEKLAFLFSKFEQKKPGQTIILTLSVYYPLFMFALEIYVV